MDKQQDPHFDRYADSYDALHRDSVRFSGEEPGYFAAYKVDHIAERLGNLTVAPRILDFGCGVGGSIAYLRSRFPQARLHGLDVSGESLALAARAHPDVDFGQIDGGKLPLADGSIDVAMAACVYHHIAPSERAHWTAELRRVLRPGGRLFVFEHNPLNPLTQKVVRDCPFDDDAILLPRRESLGLLRDAGFTGVGARYIVFFPQALSALRPLERRLSWLPAGAQYVADGRA